MYIKIMNRFKFRLLAVVVIANMSTFVGMLIFNWKPITLVAIFALDVLFAITRTTFERSVVRRPPNVESENIYGFISNWDALIDKRGCYRLPVGQFAVYPRNLAYVLRSIFIMVSIGTFAFGFYYLGDSAGSRPAVWNLEATLVVLIPVLVAKHVTIAAVWAADGIYDRASVETVRPWEPLFATLVGLFAIGGVLVMPPEILSTIVAIVLIPKVLFDLREAGIGPSILTFDPTCDREDDIRSPPTKTPHAVFCTDRRAIMSGALIVISVLFFTYHGPIVVGFLAGLTHTLVGLEVSVTSVSWLLTATIAIVYGVGLLVARIEYANLEYRIYDDTLLAYDTSLEAVQWEVPLEAITAVSVKHTIRSRLVPFCGPSVRLEYRGDDPPVENLFREYKLEKIGLLCNPTEMADLIDRMRKQRGSSSNEAATETRL